MSGIKIPVRADISQLKSDLQEITKEAERINRSLGNNRVNFDVDKARDQLNKIWQLANKLESSIGKTHKITVDTADSIANHGLIPQNKNAVQYSQECRHRKPGTMAGFAMWDRASIRRIDDQPAVEKPAPAASEEWHADWFGRRGNSTVARR